MLGDPAKEKLSRLLETYYCDADDHEMHGSELKGYADEYLSRYELDQSARVYKALADEKRLKILRLLTFREMCVCELTIALDLTQPNLTHHIKKLEYAGLVGHEKRGKWVYYSLKDVDCLKSVGAI